MPIQLAKEIIDHELSIQSEFEEFEIDLAGGEPFMHFDYLQEVVDFCIENKERWNKKIHIYIGSNLTLLTPTMEKWIEEHQGLVYLGTSLDGTKKVHDKCRSNSYDSVIRNIPFYKKMYPHQMVKMTISADSVDSVYEGIQNIEGFGLKYSANVVFEEVWGDAASKQRHLKNYAEQLDKLVHHYFEHPELEVPMLLALPIRRLLQKEETDHRWCGSGSAMCCYDTDGRKLPCHRFARFSTNKRYEGERSISERIKTKCDDCPFIDACPTCVGHNWQTYGHPDSRTSFHCEFIKLQFLATAKLLYLKNVFLIKELAKGNIGEDSPSKDSETLRNLQAAYFVLQHLDQESIIKEVSCPSPN